ncbi:MAG: ABC transporter ATP-binding protein [Sphaerochaeta sp.]
MLLECKNICRQFKRLRGETNVFLAVKKTDFAIDRGELVTVYGASGSGKSTLLNMLAGLLKPTGGQVFIDGKNLYEMTDLQLSMFRNRNIGVIPQGQTAIQTLNVLENVLLPYTLLKENRKNSGYEETEKKAQNLLLKMGIAELENIMPSELSGGELRRMAIARGLIMEPEAVLADEPTADLDSENTQVVLGLLRQTADAGRAVLVVTHDPEVLRYSDRAFEMRNGIIEEIKNI